MADHLAHGAHHEADALLTAPTVSATVSGLSTMPATLTPEITSVPITAGPSFDISSVVPSASATAAAVPLAAAAFDSHSHAVTASSGHSHGEAGMPMFFTTSYGNPVLFSTVAPTTPVAIFGVWVAIFTLALIYRGLVCARAYVEAVYWSPSASGSSAASLFEDEVGKGLRGRGRGVVQGFEWKRDLGRGAMGAVTSVLGYGLMLVVMSFVVGWFLAVVAGLAVGEVVFARLTAGRR